jgi:hypothetical protein
LVREREAMGAGWTPRFFTGAVTPVGKPELTAEGERALKLLEAGEWTLEERRE